MFGCCAVLCCAVVQFVELCLFIGYNLISVHAGPRCAGPMSRPAGADS